MNLNLVMDTLWKKQKRNVYWNPSFVGFQYTSKKYNNLLYQYILVEFCRTLATFFMTVYLIIRDIFRDTSTGFIHLNEWELLFHLQPLQRQL